MIRSIVRVCAAAAVLAVAPPLEAQQSSGLDSIRTPHGTCGVWVGIPGGSNPETDRVYAPCAVDRPAVLLSDSALPQPWISPSISGHFTVVVNEDGAVEPRLTRAWSIAMDSVSYRLTLERLRQWRFRPAMRSGVPVRSGFILRVRTEERPDTLPAELRWTYRQFPFGEDSLVGRWVTLPGRPAPLAPEQRDSLYAGLFRRLVDMRVLAPWLDQPYCVVAARGDQAPQTQAHLSDILHRVFSHAAGEDEQVEDDMRGLVLPPGCERQPGALRLFLSSEHRTEGNRVVVSAAGDYLADWPPGYRGATFPGWSGRCVMDVPSGAPSRVHCDIHPRYTFRSGPRPWDRSPAPKWYQPGDSIHVTVVARMRDAFQADTLRASLQDLRRFRQSAVLDSRSDCTTAWGAFTQQDTAELYIVSGSLEGPSRFDVTRVRHGPPPPRPRGHACRGAAGDSLFAVFFLGQLGDSVRAAVTFCAGRPLCTGQYEVDPARHAMAVQPALRFRIQDLREKTRVGDQLDFRIYVDPVPEGLIPLVIVRHPGMPMHSMAVGRVELGAWEFAATYGPGLPADSEILIYLVAR